MKIKSIVKYNINNLKNSIAIYYSILSVVCIALVVFSKIDNSTVSSSGIEISSVIFMFVAGLNLFKENFHFMKSNNVSRKDFLYGTVISMIPVAIFMSVLDIIINRIFNIFLKCPTIYDMTYTNMGSGELYNTINWIQSNSIETLFNSIIFQASLCLVAVSLGFVITIVYYKCNKLMKIIISVSPAIISMIIGIVGEIYPEFIININKFIGYIFGFNSRNVYQAILTLIVLFIIFIAAARLLTRKVTIKQR